MSETKLADAGTGLPPATANMWRPGEFTLRDAWFPIAHSATVAERPLRREVHSQPFYLWQNDGEIRATEFHPAKPNAGVRTFFTGGTGYYPVQNRYGHVWVWYGDPANADPDLIPDIPFLPLHRLQPAYSWGVNFFHCTYELVLENILDLTHIDYVHAVYAGTGEEAEEDAIRYESTSETVTMIRTIKGRPTSKYQREVLGVTKNYMDMTAFTHVFIRSGMCFLHSHYSDAPSIPLMQSNTPESRTLTRANYMFGIEQTDNERYALEWPKTAAMVAAQDEAVLNPQNPRYLGHAPRGDCSTRFDAAGLFYRKQHNALIDRQKSGDFAYLPDIKDGSDLAEILHVSRPI